MKQNFILTIVKIVIPVFQIGIAGISNADYFVRDDVITDPKPSHFNICHGGTCEELAMVSLNQHQWQSVKKIFAKDNSAEDERKSIRRAIARMETLVGSQTETYNDKGENKVDPIDNHYMDCIDESINTTIYLTMLKKNGVIRLHTIEERGNRGFFFNGWPHTTAVIRDKTTAEHYAVDSWFLDNGELPFIVPLSEWHDGWRPVKITK